MASISGSQTDVVSTHAAADVEDRTCAIAEWKNDVVGRLLSVVGLDVEPIRRVGL